MFQILYGAASLSFLYGKGPDVSMLLRSFTSMVNRTYRDWSPAVSIDDCRGEVYYNRLSQWIRSVCDESIVLWCMFEITCESFAIYIYIYIFVTEICMEPACLPFHNLLYSPEDLATKQNKILLHLWIFIELIT